MVRDKIITIDESTLKIQWHKDRDYIGGTYWIVKNLCPNYDIYYLKAQGQDKQDKLLLLTNSTIWSAFESVTVLTYRFNTLDFDIYCRLYGIPVKPYHIENGTFIEGYKEEYPFRTLGAALNDTHFNYTLSKTWYAHNKGTADFAKLNKAVVYACRKANNLYYWCTFKNYEKWFKHKWVSLQKSDEKTRAKGIKSFCLSCNAKATNEYTDRTTAIYTCGRYMHPDMKRFLDFRGIPYDEEQ